MVDTYVHVKLKIIIIRTTYVGSKIKKRKQEKFDESIHRQRRNRTVATRRVAQESFCSLEEMQDAKTEQPQASKNQADRKKAVLFSVVSKETGVG